MFGNLRCAIVPRYQSSSEAQALCQEIEKMYLNYHNANYSTLEDAITFNEHAEYLKRHYEEYQFPSKIAMLSQYYQYHRELPRIFQNELHSIIANYQEDVRSQEYQLVTKKLKDGNYEQAVLTERDKRRPVDKIIKNIELSYYNFEKKEVKKAKQPILAKNKKSMPSLPLYQHKHNTHKQPHSLKTSAQHINTMLKPKDMNKLSIKSREKEQPKKASLNNSTESPKNLSRSKSKSNLAMLNPDPILKRNSVKAHQEPPVPQKNKSNPVSLHKTSSTKNVLKREEPKKLIRVGEAVNSVSDKNGLKSMFKKAMQTKKLIKIAR